MKKNICFIVPAYNESSAIKSCLEGLKKAGVDWNDVYIVDDGSKDNTYQHIEEVRFPLQNVLVMKKNSGKAKAIAAAFNHFGLQKKYEWLNFMDADSIVDAKYYSRAKKLTDQADVDTMAFCSHVQTQEGVYNIPTAYRVYEYFISHWVYKEAQTRLGVLTVLPGCGSCYRTEMLDMHFSKDEEHTLVEDMDWTILTHLSGKGKIEYDRNLVVYTQDPGTVGAYVRQIDRWQRGCWQVFLKRDMHQVWHKPIKAELAFLLLEGLVFSAVTVAVSIYALAMRSGQYAIGYLLLDGAAFILANVIAAIVERDIRPIVFLPTSYMLRFINCVVFLKGFIQIVILRIDKKTKLSWNKVARY